MAALLSTTSAYADNAQTQVRAALTSGGDAARLTIVTGGKQAGVKLAVKDKSIELYNGDAVATLEAGHGRVLVAVSVDAKKQPFQILTIADGKVGKPIGLSRPNKRSDFPFAIAATATPDGFTVFFQEVEPDNANEAHTYMVELDKTGAVTEEAREIQVPWWLAAAAWNGKGYHLGLFYAGEANGTRLSMVSLTKEGSPEQHPDWATQPGMLSEVHLVSAGGSIRAIYRGTGNRMYQTDVTKIGQWGQVSAKTKDLGALGKDQAIAITAKGAVTKIKAK
ncbi:MAG TPA: hypothetical protein VIV11_34480 [Kofleriaceae bacterium]